MGYIESNLLSDEEIVYKARLHGIIFWKAFALISLGIVFFLIQPIAGVIVIVIGVFALSGPIIDYVASEFGVTNKRVIIKVGFLRRRTLELLLRHVEAISVDQSVTGRILGFGSITLTGTGGVREVFHNISSPLEFRRQIQGEAGDDDNRQPPRKESGNGPRAEANQRVLIQIDIFEWFRNWLFFGFFEELLEFRFENL